MKLLWMLLLAASCTFVRAQTNPPAVAATQHQKIWINSDHFYFEGASNQGVYFGHVIATDRDQATLKCERLTVSVPTGGGHPTNIVAETNVIVDLNDKKQKYHITAQKAVYAYGTVNSVTNETITFTGGDPGPRVETSQAVFTGNPIVYDVISRSFGGTDFGTVLDTRAMNGTNNPNGTNATPFNLFH